jgi:hypothetical protein
MSLEKKTKAFVNGMMYLIMSRACFLQQFSQLLEEFMDAILT